MSDPKKTGVLGHPIQTILKAARYSARKHKGQTRLDGSTPYASHPTSVAFILRHIFEVEDESIIAAALLHDVLEDTRTKYDEIVELFGTEIANYVVALTKNPLLSKKDREREFEQRLLKAPEAVKIAKLADMFDNLVFRLESPRLPRTLATARKLVTSFEMQSEKGKLALAKIAQLVEEIERETGLKASDAEPE